MGDRLPRNSTIQKLTQYADVLITALPYIQRLAGKTIVIKYGGNAMQNDALTQKVLQDVTLLKFVGMNPVLVHGGGPEINSLLKSLGIQPQFVNGLRVTDAETMKVVQMVLTGKINKDITSKLNAMGGKAIGLSGKDANLIECVKKPVNNGVDLGFVGDITGINTKLLNDLCTDEYIPVIAPIGTGPNGESYNINADTVAAEIAAKLGAEKLMFLTDIDGIRTNAADPDTLIFHATLDMIDEFVANGTISGGMIPKVRACVEAVKAGVERVHILDGTIEHPIVLEIFTDTGIGTMVTK